MGNHDRTMTIQKEAFVKDQFGAGIDDSLFAVNNVSLRKGDFRIHDISFSFPKGKIMSLLGPSVSGKTLLLKAIAGLEQLTGGTIFLGKSQLDFLSPSQRKIGFVFEDYALFPHLNAKRNIEFPLKIDKKDKRVVDVETARRIDELDIDTSYLKVFPDILPPGVKQLVAIARGKNHDFNLFVMDEPMTQLDAAQHVQTRMFLQKMVREMERTTIIAFNDPEDAMALSDYIGVIAEGRLLQFGEAWEIYHHPLNLLVMELVSSLGVNTLRVEIQHGQTHPYKFPVEKEDGLYDMAFRPEELQLAPDGIPGRIDSSQFLTPKRKIASCRIEGDLDVRLLLPAEAEEYISFLPLKPQFFPVEI